MSVEALKTTEIRILGKRINRFYLMMAGFVVFIGLGVWAGDFQETFLNGSTL